MTNLEFRAKHDLVIKEVIKRQTEKGIQCKILQNINSHTGRETIMAIHNEVYSVMNDGEKTSAFFLGYLR